MRSLVNFFNHGIFPFTGRSEPLDRLIAFWQGTADAPGLRVALVVGEAGMGKSRLVEEYVPRVTASGGAVVHARLYPGGATSIAGLLLEAIRHSAVGKTLLKKIPGESIGGVISALQRLSRLRPTLIVIEDIHLLGEDARGDFVALLDAISDEPISLLCLARPIELAMRGVLERYLVEEIDLQGLGPEPLGELWRELFGTTASPEIIDVLGQVTLGNPLALRSALRGALKEGALVRDEAEGWRVALSPTAFGETLLRNVEILSEGMVAHLNEWEKKLAGELASLGEVFAREAADAMIGDADRVLDLLTFKGILFPTTTPIAPLPGPSTSAPLLAFTHTLLHRYFVHHGDVDPDRIAIAIASDLPLYSILPFQILTEQIGTLNIRGGTITDSIDRALRVAYWLDSTSDWQLAPPLLSAAEALEQIGIPEWSEVERLRIRRRILGCRLRILRRTDHLPVYREMVEELIRLTEDPATDEEARERIAALTYLLKMIRRADPVRAHQVIAESDLLLERFPETRFTSEYLGFFQILASTSAKDDDSGHGRSAERRLEALLQDPDVPEEFRRRALREIAPLFLWMFVTPEELERRMKMLKEIEEVIEEEDFIFRTRQAAFYDGIGMAQEAVTAVDRIVPVLRERGLLRHVHQILIVRLYALSWLGLSLEDLERQIKRVISEAPEEMRSWLTQRSGPRLVRIGLDRGDPVWADHIIDDMLGGNLSELDAAERFQVEIARGTLAASLEELLHPDICPAGLDRLLRAAAGEDIPRKEVIDEARSLCSGSILTRASIGSTYATVELIMLLDDRYRTSVLGNAIGDVLRRVLRWLAERRLFGYLGPAIERARPHLPAEEIEVWEGEYQRIIRQEQATAEPIEGKLRVSMVGTVQVHQPGSEPLRVRGARLRTMLGLLVADRMLERPLSYREFCRIAADGELDQERARKVMNMGVLRLREIVGTDAVLTDRVTPQLNCEKVQVDLLDAHELLRRAIEAIREGSLARAQTALMAVLERTRGEVPFPTLYDSFFEAAREEFEHSLRTAIINLGRGLLDEGDAPSAEEILRRGFEGMPGDEEIAELLRETLVSLGKRMEAERVRMRVMEES